jgi:hypothetical protein
MVEVVATAIRGNGVIEVSTTLGLHELLLLGIAILSNGVWSDQIDSVLI